MNELLPVGERGRELTDAEWAQIERDVDMGYLSYDDACRKWGVKPPSYQIVHANSQPLPDQNISVNKKTPPCERSRFDTRTQQAHEASGQGPLTEKQKQINRDGIAMARTALRNARAACRPE